MLTVVRGLGADMAILDTAYFCSQVLLLTAMGYVVHLTHSATTYLATAAILSATACYFIYTAIYTAKDIPKSYTTFHTKPSNSLNDRDIITLTLVES